VPAAMDESFLFLFFKKEVPCLPFSYLGSYQKTLGLSQIRHDRYG